MVEKIKYSIELLKKAEKLALNMSPDGFYLAFSGGKDSQALYHVAKMAGVKFTAHYNLTTLDPPELVKFIKSNYPDVTIHRPELTFLQLIKIKSILPLRKIRYCCEVLKEKGGVGRCVAIGIRAAESRQRAGRMEIEKLAKRKKDKKPFDFEKSEAVNFQCIGGGDKITVSPILNWSDRDVWKFIKDNGIEYCKLYDEGWSRIGCLFCPMVATKEKRMHEKRYPKYVKAIKKAIRHMIDNNGYLKTYRPSEDEVFDMWVSNKSAKVYFHEKRNQLKLF